MVELVSSLSKILQTGGVSYAGFSPPVCIQDASFPGCGTRDLMCSIESNAFDISGRSLLRIGLRRSNERETGRAGCASTTTVRGLDAALGCIFDWRPGLNTAALAFGWNSLPSYLSPCLDPCPLATPLERREKLGSTGFDGPVGGCLS